MPSSLGLLSNQAQLADTCAALLDSLQLSMQLEALLRHGCWHETTVVGGRAWQRPGFGIMMHRGLGLSTQQL